ncbi:Cupin 2 conserved barrel [Penicillium argentinense]|uniref:Cupin 2 conserved barrel n=1 Tax=Penicillium argentinense TaxID=1131581 RepID=A0A9W9F812_9EURO|nr:Cupin 2 conserved barrel [Penicillium argentinense]KAJ5095288.1 Cupin 2 conserved barrel [Penicillium argentinense]
MSLTEPITADTEEKLLADLEASKTLPLWKQMTRLNPPSPNPTTIPNVWKYKSIRPNLERAGNLVPESQAERRVLMLVNPARGTSTVPEPPKYAPYTTDTLYAGLQLVMPNETARAHRHTAFAMRFIIEGKGGFTAVHGKRITMQRGDVILTPTWNYHDHGKDGSGPMVWLDGLDLPSFTHFPVHFAQHFDLPRYPAADVESADSPLVFAWNDMKARLDAMPGEWACCRYLRDGREVSRVLGGCAERLSAGASAPSRRETTSAVYHVVAGRGRSVINGQVYKWEEGDTFCVPAWYRYQHLADGAVYLYRFDDRPMIEALGFYREEDMDVEGLVSE